jgi:ATP-dependent Clp protease ATP-binding subunit ClpA
MYPFERFTEGAKQVLTRAQEEAVAWGRQYIGTEHLALALCGDKEGVAGRVLADLNVTYEAVEAQVSSLLSRSTSTQVELIIPTSRVKRIVELAFQEATIAGDEFVGSEHLLLALLVEAEGAGAMALDQLGATLPKVRRAVRAMLDDRPPQQGAVRAGTVGTSPSVGVAFMRAGQMAKEEGVNDIRADHLIRAMAASDIAELHGVLRKLRLTPEAVAADLTVPEEIRQLGLAARAARRAQAAAFNAGGAEAARAVEEVTRRSQEHSEAVSRWLAGGNAQ